MDDIPLSTTSDRFLSLITLGLGRGEWLVGATTPEDYRKYLEKDGHWSAGSGRSPFDRPHGKKPSPFFAGCALSTKSTTSSPIQDDALEAAVDLSDRHLPGSLPDKALDALDEAAAAVRLKTHLVAPEIRILITQMDQLTRDKEEAVANQDFDRAAELRNQVDKLKQEKEAILQEVREKSPLPAPYVDYEAVAEIVRQRSGGLPDNSS